MSNFVESSYRTWAGYLSTNLGAVKVTMNDDNQQFTNARQLLLLWYANIDDIIGVDDEDPLILSLLPDEKLKVKRFLFQDDQKRALLSILLQRALIRSYTGASDSEYELRRSKEVRGCVMNLVLISIQYM